jgi:L-alanine-DL-glutamate epimerase-like enolase superfamily enzyme
MVALFVAHRLRPILLGQDPIAHEKLWDQMHRIMVHGRQGDAMLAISAIDCALWDLKGRWLDQPVYRLLGGPTRDTVPCLCLHAGLCVLDMGRVTRACSRIQGDGLRPAQKWFFRHGPMSGPDGMRKNVELVRTLRETLGEDDDIMLDCWQSFEPTYAIELADTHRRIPAALAGGMRDARPHRQLPGFKDSISDPAVRRRARIHPLGFQALHRRQGAGYPAARYLLGGRPLRDC